MPRCDGDKGLDDLPGDGIRPADHAGLNDRRMLHEGGFDLEGADQVASRLDDIIGTADKPEVAVRVPASEITGEVPKGRMVAGLVVQVGPEHRGPARAQRQFALVIGPVDDGDLAIAHLGPAVRTAGQDRRFHAGR